MAKLFTKIAGNLNGLTQVYNDSPVSNPIFANIENLTSASPVDPVVVNENSRRVEIAYNLYTGNWAKSKTEAVLTANKLQVGTTIRRKRLSDFYGWLPTNNPYITYSPNSTKAENGSLMEIRPYGKGVESLEKMKQDSVQLALVSGPRDEKLMFNYLKTRQGIIFLAMQQTLQGGNTFKQTRKYDPTSVLTITAKNTLASLTNKISRVDRALGVDTSNAGRLQIETVADRMNTISRNYAGGSNGGSNRNSLLGRTANTAASRLVQDIYNRTNISIRNKKINLGQLNRTFDRYAQTLNSILRATNVANSSLKQGETAYTYNPTGASTNGSLFDQGYPFVKDPQHEQLKYSEAKQQYIDRAKENISRIKGKLHINTFTDPYGDKFPGNKSSEGYDTGVRAGSGNAVGTSYYGISSAKYIKDPMNYVDDKDTPIRLTTDLVDNKHANSDFITFKISVPGVYGSGVNFRAFLKDIKHSAKGDFEEQRYVGRPERFIVYKGLSRAINFSLYLVAFSQNELNGMWTRANMLNKLVYPINTTAGYMVPPIIRLTLGNILNEQPGYITDINMNFADVPWDIDNEVTNVIQCDVVYHIIEKNYIAQSDPSSNAFAISDVLYNEKTVTDQNASLQDAMLQAFLLGQTDPTYYDDATTERAETNTSNESPINTVPDGVDTGGRYQEGASTSKYPPTRGEWNLVP